jgi:hypothetical protein
MYAGLGMIGYGKTFVGMSLKGIRAVLRVGVKILAKVFGLQIFSKILEWLNRQRDLEGFEGIWENKRSSSSNLGNIVVILRVAALIGNFMD